MPGRSNLDYARRKPKQSLETFRRLRAENYELLKGLPGERLRARRQPHRTGPHDAARACWSAIAEHAESHARQMQAIREEYKKAKGRNETRSYGR